MCLHISETSCSRHRGCSLEDERKEQESNRESTPCPQKNTANFRVSSLVWRESILELFLCDELIRIYAHREMSHDESDSLIRPEDAGRCRKSESLVRPEDVGRRRKTETPFMPEDAGKVRVSYGRKMPGKYSQVHLVRLLCHLNELAFYAKAMLVRRAG